MKYLCLIYTDERVLQAMPEPEWRSLVEQCLRFSASLERDGMYLAGEALESVTTATTLRVRAGKVSFTDGPFAETKEQLAGFYLIEAEGLHEALHAAAGIPAARLGSIEVRPVMSLAVGSTPPAQ